MRPSRSFAKLEGMAIRRVYRLRTRSVAAIGAANIEMDRQLAYVVIEALNLWANFCRSYLLSCLLAPRRRNGGKVTLGNAIVTTPAALMHIAAQAHRGISAPVPTSRRDEPPWHNRQLVLRTCQAVQCSHLAAIQAALSVNTAVFEDLAKFRNFYAHRNEDTAAQALAVGKNQYLIFGPHHPTGVLASAAYKRTQPLILDWLDDMRAVIELMCE